MISLQNGWLFIHVPRTGGNSLQGVLSPYSDDRLVTGRFRDGVERFGVRGPHTANKHATIRDYADALPRDVFADLFKFTIVRNPWERAISAYFTPMRWLRIGEAPHWVKEDFIAGLPELPSMTEMLRGSNAAIEIDFLLRFENLHHDVADLFVRLGLENETFPHRNQGLYDHHWRRYYADHPDLVGLIGEIYGDDVEAFGYRFSE